MKYVFLLVISFLSACSWDYLENEYFAEPTVLSTEIPEEKNDIVISNFDDKPIILFPQMLVVKDDFVSEPAALPKEEVILKKKQLEKKLEKIQAKDCPYQDKFQDTQSISSVYKVFLKNNKKPCIKVSDDKVLSHLISVFIQDFESQAIRILNADPNFLTFYNNVFMYASQSDKIALNQKIMDKGCRLLSNESCIEVKKAIF